MDTYDYVIIGGGPAGLTAAYYLAKNHKRILIIDRESEIGGCHRVRRIGGLFTEHGPRIISRNYFSLIAILNEFGVGFDDLYTVYNFGTAIPVAKLLSVLDFREMYIFAQAFLQLMISDSPSRHMTMEEFVTKHQFKPESVDLIDVLCRVTDGGTIRNYTLYEFLQLPNQNMFYQFYQPKYPNDVGLFDIWADALDRTGYVDLLLQTQIEQIMTVGNSIQLITNQNQNQTVITGLNYIFAIPPKPMVQILSRSFDPNMFGVFDQLVQWEIQSRYLVYIPIIFHWDKKLSLEKKWGVAESAYGIVYVVMSDYMNFDDPRSKTVIVCTVKNSDRISTYNNKTADECTESELIAEVFRQLQLHQPNLPIAQFQLLNPGIYKNPSTNKWDTTDTAYFYTKAGYRSNKSAYANIFWIGTHNGNSSYSFTSMESAMQNAIYLLHELIPASRTDIRIEHAFTIKKFIWILIIVCVGMIIWYKYQKN